jgi:3-oxoacyl-[acyl-carrier protein] reductase
MVTEKKFKFKKISKAVVFGGSSGIGFAIAKKLADNNVDLVVISRSEKKLKAAVGRLGKIGSGKKFYIKCDVSKYEEVESAICEAEEKIGGIDCLINSAGVSIHGEIDRLSESDFNEVIDINLKGVFNCSRAVWPIFKKKNNGQLVVISSASGLAGYATGTIYCASKSGVNGFLEALALEGKEAGIRVFNICPGQVNTPIWSSTDSVVARAKKGMLEGESVADLCWYLINRPSIELFQKVVIQPFLTQPNLRGRNRGPGGIFPKHE